MSIQATLPPDSAFAYGCFFYHMALESESAGAVGNGLGALYVLTGVLSDKPVQGENEFRTRNYENWSATSV